MYAEVRRLEKGNRNFQQSWAEPLIRRKMVEVNQSKPGLSTSRKAGGIEGEVGEECGQRGCRRREVVWDCEGRYCRERSDVHVRKEGVEGVWRDEVEEGIACRDGERGGLGRRNERKGCGERGWRRKWREGGRNVRRGTGGRGGRDVRRLREGYMRGSGERDEVDGEGAERRLQESE